MPPLPRFLCLITLLWVFASLEGVARQQGQPPAEGVAATIETRTGDLVEGIFVSATETEVVFRVAGQPLTLPMETIRYISFDGRIRASTRGHEEGEAIALRAAIGALQSLKAQVDALDFENSQSQLIFVASLNAALPPITTFLSSVGDNWADVNHAIRMAMRYYRAAPDNDGTLDAGDLLWAGSYVDYADQLSGDGPGRGD